MKGRCQELILNFHFIVSDTGFLLRLPIDYGPSAFLILNCARHEGISDVQKIFYKA